MKKVIGVLLLIAIIGGVVAYKMYNKPHRDIDAEAATVSLTAGELFGNYEESEEKSNTLYLDKVVEVSGTISELSENAAGNLTMLLADGDAMGGVSATCDASVQKEGLEVGQAVKIKGRCTGLNMFDVEMSNCFIVE
jgi:hypothetical protein